MELTFLGTGAGRPSRQRNVTAMALTLPPPRCSAWLFDCGEATQHQLMNTPIKISRIEAVFITHLHGDHVNGLPGLLSSRSYHPGAGPLRLFGPTGLKAYLEAVFSATYSHLEYELIVTELVEGVVYEEDDYTVEAYPLQHRVPCWGYRLTEKDRPGALDAEKARALGVPFGPLLGQLKNGRDVRLPDGRTVRSSDVTAPDRKGRVITILGDTVPCDNIARLAANADLLVHEATFQGDMAEKAAAYGHSTTLQAAEAARQAGAKRLYMTHFSSRYRDEDMDGLVAEARTLFPESYAGADLLAIEVPRPGEPETDGTC
ncbi:ribonuclease Z [Paenibacillus pasadenensis]|uniref:Ribonuclease Z n=1 Tax=Paenibacillus pasadenensis TaxID=217090 RepID=A0A2N5N680_9BACL|nr:MULTISPECIES: ribonuclease Z [Paenibacillus]PLT45835.1 Ribonuclease Z [Paenibacillus pasadenensis]QGG56265.1 ribonuclease Z [Paenibacillus sp. B01]